VVERVDGLLEPRLGEADLHPRLHRGLRGRVDLIERLLPVLHRRHERRAQRPRRVLFVERICVIPTAPLGGVDRRVHTWCLCHPSTLTPSDIDDQASPFTWAATTTLSTARCGAWMHARA